MNLRAGRAGRLQRGTGPVDDGTVEQARVSEVATPRTMAATSAFFYAFGALTGLLAALGLDSGSTARTVLLGLAGTAFLAALVIARWAPRWPRSTFHVQVALGTSMITVAMLVSDDAGTALVFGALMTFSAIDAFFFFRRRAAIVHLAAAVVAATTALQLRGDVPVVTALALDTVIVAVGVITRLLVELASRATVDPLTGLANRRGFDEALQQSVADASRTGSPMAAVLLDLDRFKEINDSDGHEAGDRVLCQVAAAWRGALPKTAVIARHGGDEFALLLAGSTGGEAVDLVRRLVARHPDIGISCGVTEYQPGDSAAQVMRRADHALYMAKASGRGRVELDSGSASGLAQDLAVALAAGDVQVHYQPIVDLATGTLTGLEAVARWTHPSLGQVSPEQFVAVAEQNGLVTALGEYVMRTAFTELTPLRRALGGSLGLGLNVSGRELVDPDYAGRVRRMVAESGWPAGDVVLEVTESLMEAHSSTAVRALRALRASGLRVAIDDFGTGYSSLSRLDTLPVDILKFDHSFIAPIATSPRRAQMLRSIVGMAAALGLSLVAEGVESEEQNAVLLQEGCRYAQGWLYGRAVPLGELVDDVGRFRRELVVEAASRD